MSDGMMDTVEAESSTGLRKEQSEMFQNSCIRVMASAALMLGSALTGCSSAERPSPAADTPEVRVIAEAAPPSAPPIEATPPAAQPDAASTPDQPKPASAAGMRMFIDPVTGMPRDPTDAELAAMAQAQKDGKVTAATPSREIKLKKRGVAVMMEDNEAPLQSCVTPEGLTIDHACAQAQPQVEQDSKGDKP